MKNLMKMNDVLTDEMALVFGGKNDVVDVVCSGDGIVLPSEPTTNLVNLF